MMADTIEPGTLVEWTSQAGSYWKTKQGTVLAYCPRMKDPRDILRVTRGVIHLPNERTDGLSYSEFDRYLVSVPRGGKSKLVDIYTPLASKVRPQ
jgi:hypothetical protein